MKTRILVGSTLVGLFVALQSLAAPVNINKADATTLAEALSGVGPAISKEIVSYREENGGFTSPEELMNVKGIGEKIFEDNKSDILVGD